MGNQIQKEEKTFQNQLSLASQQEYNHQITNPSHNRIINIILDKKFSIANKVLMDPI